MIFGLICFCCEQNAALASLISIPKHSQEFQVLNPSQLQTETSPLIERFQRDDKHSPSLKAGIELKVELEESQRLLELITIDTFAPEFLDINDRLTFKVSDKAGDALEIPEETFLEADLTHVSNDNKQLTFKVNSLINSSGKSIKADGVFQIDTKKQEKNFSERLNDNTALKTTSNLSIGAIGGTIKTLQYGGLPLLMLTEGFSAVAGASLGAVSGLINAINYNPVNKFSLPSGSVIKVKFTRPLEIDQTKLAELKTPLTEPLNAEFISFNVKVKNLKKFYSYNFGDSLLVELKIDNASEENFDSKDFILIEKNTKQEFLPNPLLLGLELLNQSEINSESSKILKLCYSVGKFSDLAAYELQIIDPISLEHLYYLPINFKKI